jgi:hypothetical protein
MIPAMSHRTPAGPAAAALLVMTTLLALGHLARGEPPGPPLPLPEPAAEARDEPGAPSQETPPVEPVPAAPGAKPAGDGESDDAAPAEGRPAQDYGEEADRANAEPSPDGGQADANPSQGSPADVGSREADPADAKAEPDGKPDAGAKPGKPKPDTTVYVLALSGGSEAESRPMVFLFRRVGNLSKELPVRYQITGTAEAGSDYKPVPGTVVFPPGKSVVSLQVDILDDVQVEGDETMQLQILPPADAAEHDRPDEAEPRRSR